MTRLFIVRHAVAVDPDDLRLPGPDGALLPAGRAQAWALGHRLRALGPSAVYSSDARRARETGEIIAAACQIPLEVDAALREIDLGMWAGQTYADVVAADPAARAWFTDPSTGVPPGGESIAVAAERVLEVMRALGHGDGERVVVVGHAGSLRLALAQALGMPLSSYWRLRLDCASLSVLMRTADGLLLERLNDTAHLEAPVSDEPSAMSGHITLVIGGARSGKSTWAEQSMTQRGGPVLYVATATAGDDEMAERIARHRAKRPSHWRTIEEPDRLLDAIQANATTGDTVLVDCLTLWVSNVVLKAIGPERDPDAMPPAAWADIEASIVNEVNALLTVARERELTLILVSNEVGMGIVPATTLGRRYRDTLGRVNQAVGSTADAVILMVAGLAVDLRQFTAG